METGESELEKLKKELRQAQKEITEWVNRHRDRDERLTRANTILTEMRSLLNYGGWSWLFWCFDSLRKIRRDIEEHFKFQA